MRLRGFSLRRFAACFIGAAIAAPLISFALANAVTAHGTHPRFLAPAHGEIVEGELRVHVAHPGIALPYLNLRVLALPTPDEARSLASDPLSVPNNHKGRSVWEGLLSLDTNGYAALIDTAAWEAGSYAVEVQFLGDVIDEKYLLPFVLGPK